MRDVLYFTINLVVPRGNRYKPGHMYTCPTKQKLSTKCATLKRSLDSVGQTEYFCRKETLAATSDSNDTHST